MADDLDAENGRNRPDGGLSGVASPAIGTFVPPLQQSSDTMTRKWVSYALLALLFIIVVAAFISLFVINASPTSEADAILDSRRLMQLLNIVFGPIVALVSSVVGFYFGANTARAGAASGG